MTDNGNTAPDEQEFKPNRFLEEVYGTDPVTVEDTTTGMVVGGPKSEEGSVKMEQQYQIDSIMGKIKDLESKIEDLDRQDKIETLQYGEPNKRASEFREKAREDLRFEIAGLKDSYSYQVHRGNQLVLEARERDKQAAAAREQQVKDEETIKQMEHEERLRNEAKRRVAEQLLINGGDAA